MPLGLWLWLLPACLWLIDVRCSCSFVQTARNNCGDFAAAQQRLRSSHGKVRLSKQLHILYTQLLPMLVIPTALELHPRSQVTACVLTPAGFDIRVSNMGGALGAGSYFAEHLSYSLGYVNRVNIISTKAPSFHCRLPITTALQCQLYW
jgi:hypothetical protein